MMVNEHRAFTRSQLDGTIKVACRDCSFACWQLSAGRAAYQAVKHVIDMLRWERKAQGHV